MRWGVPGSQLERAQCRPAGVVVDFDAPARNFVAVGATRRAEPGAVVTAVGSRGQLEQDGVAHDLVEVDGVAIEEVGLAVDGAGLEQLIDADGQRALDRAQAATALRGPLDVDLTSNHDALGNALEHGIDVNGNVGRNRDRTRREIGERGVDVNVALGPRPAQEVGDDDSQTGRNGHLGRSFRDRAPDGGRSVTWL
jgi:hypothetical protein